MTRRFLVALTEGELGAIRSLVNVTIESTEPLDNYERAHLKMLARAQDKLDHARELPISDIDWHALDYAAGDLLDSDPDGWADHRRAVNSGGGPQRLGNPFRARTAITKAMRFGAKP